MGLNHLEQNYIKIVVKELGIPSRKFDGSPNPIWKMTVSVMGSVCELERDSISERMHQGCEAYKQRGGKFERNYEWLKVDIFFEQTKNPKDFSFL